MGFFSTNIELLPASKYDAGVDQWNALYSDLKKKLILTFGNAAGTIPADTKKPTKSGNLPAVPYGVAVGIAIQFASELANLIVTFIAQSDKHLLVPTKFVKSGGKLMTTLPLNYTDNKRETQWWDTWYSASEETRRSIAMEWLRGEVVRSNYNELPNDKELRNPAYQHILDANYRLMLSSAEGGINIVIQTREDVDPERQWLRPAVRAYQNLIWLAYDLYSLSGGGPVKPLTAYGADRFLKVIFASTQWLAIRIPSGNAGDLWQFVTRRTTEVIEQASGSAAEALNWATRTAAGAVNEAIHGLDIFTWLVIGAVGAVFLAMQ